MAKRLNGREVVRMCQEGRAKEARKVLLDLLSATSSDSKDEQRRLLELLLIIDTNTGNAKEALQVLERRRVLGYPKVAQKMDDALIAATFLYDQKRFIAARAEIIGILQDRRSLRWHGLLSALSWYVKLDELCREQMDAVLVEACATVIKKFGIPVPFDGLASEVVPAIKAAHDKYRSDSQAYSALLCRALSDRTRNGREHVVEEVRRYLNGTRAKFFENEAKNLLDKLTSTNGDDLSS